LRIRGGDFFIPAASSNETVMTFTVAIVGRPNVGKSTLFNRLVGRRLALVDDRPGVTRDRREGEARLGDLTFTVIDTAGLEDAERQTLSARIQAQTAAAMAQADAVLFVVDARDGATPTDRAFADLVRRSGKPTILIANKSEGRAGEIGALESYALGLGEPVAISAEHGEGLADLYDALRAALPDATGEPESEEEPAAADEEKPIRIAVVGRPNTGKSTLINRLLGADRLLTGPEAGITRDAIAVDLDWHGRQFRIHDTAGLRRRSRIDEKLEKLSVGDALNAIRFAEVVIVLIDSQTPFEEQDIRIADLVEREGRAIVIAVNKWDLIEHEPGAMTRLRAEVDRMLPQIKGVPVVTLSARTGDGLDRLMTAVRQSYATWNRRAPTSALNRFLAKVVSAHPPPAIKGRALRLDYITQPKARPPTFVLFSARAQALPETYRRYLINGLRENFDLPGTPIRLTLRAKQNPYAGKKKRQR
jgi:GTP-binding protein